MPTRKTAALLAYLVLHPEVHDRERLVTRFWGDFGEEQARRSLRTALSALRKALGEDALLADRETIQFNSNFPIWVDAITLRRQIQHFLDQPVVDPSLVDLTLYQGDLLDGFYDEWILRERDELRLSYLQVLLRLAHHWRSQGDYAQTIATAQQILRLEPAEEAAHQHLLFCYTKLGDRQAARQQYETCMRALREELNVEPAPETVALYRRSQQASAHRRSPAAMQSNLPIPLASFIGRVPEIAKLKTLLLGNQQLNTQPPARLLTVTGPGGCGKTRLAIQVARELLDTYADGVWWVEFAALREETQVPQAVAKVLDVQQGVQPSLTDVLITNLRTKQALLVLDNCEHLVTACAELTERLLSHCPDLQILATSREALSIFGEVSWLVPSLTLPNAQPGSPVEYLHFEAIRLFVERASAAQRDFALTPTNAPAILQICRQLDGIPLAVELAAAHVRVLSVEQIAARVNDRLRLLTIGSRSAPPRHQTLRATMDWSYDLLADIERVLLRRLSIFAGSFTFEAVEYVCAPLPVPTLDLMSQLVGKSLVMVERNVDEVSYRLLETIHEYAREKLLGSREEETLRASHLNFYIQLTEAVAPQIYRTGHEHWLARLERCHDNVRVALRWAIEQNKHAETLRLAGAMGQFWDMHGYWSEGRQWLEQALALSQAMGSTTSSASTMQSWHAEALLHAGILVWRQCNFVGARALLQESITIYRALDNRHRLGYVIANLGAVAFEQGEYAAAGTLYEEVLVMARELGNKHYIGVLLCGLGLVALNQGDYAVAQTHLAESLILLQAVEQKNGISHTLNALGNLANVQGEYTAAQRFYAETLALRRESEDKRGIAATLGDVANVTAKQGDYAAARALYAESLSLFRTLGNQRGMAYALSGLARLHHAQGHLQLATKLLGAVEALLMAMNAQLDEPEHSDKRQAIALLRSQLDETSFHTAWEEGRSFTLEQAISLARQDE